MNTLITYKLLTDIQTSQVAATPIRERPHQIYFERYRFLLLEIIRRHSYV